MRNSISRNAAIVSLSDGTAKENPGWFDQPAGASPRLWNRS